LIAVPRISQRLDLFAVEEEQIAQLQGQEPFDGLVPGLAEAGIEKLVHVDVDRFRDPRAQASPCADDSILAFAVVL